MKDRSDLVADKTSPSIQDKKNSTTVTGRRLTRRTKNESQVIEKQWTKEEEKRKERSVSHSLFLKRKRQVNI